MLLYHASSRLCLPILPNTNLAPHVQVFDSLNYLDNLLFGLDTVHAAGGEQLSSDLVYQAAPAGRC